MDIPRFSIIIPAYNEEDFIVRIISECLSLDLDKEVIVVDDGSSDRTAELVQKFFSPEHVTLIRNDKNRGKGYSMRVGLESAKGEYIVYQDADLEYPPSNILKMAGLLEQQTDMVVGVRVVNNCTLGDVSLCSLVCNKLFIRLLKIPDVWSGHRIIRREALMTLPWRSNRFEIETELTIKAVKRKWHIEFTPISYLPRSRGEGKKIGTRDFFAICWTYCREMFAI